MPLTPEQAFQIGFLLRCADEGLPGPQLHERMEKAASLLEKSGFSLGGMTSLGVGGLLAIPAAAGVAGGYMANRTAEDTLDEEDVKKQELIAELRHWARRAREQKKTRSLLPPH